jgi:hypothetical protein
MGLSGGQWLMAGVGAFGAALAAWTAVVYHGWLFANHSSVDRARRRIWWFFLSHDLWMSRATPFGVLLGCGFALIGFGAIPVVEQPDHPAIAVVAVGWLVMMAGVVLTFLRPRRFLAPWHRMELERAEAGLAPLIEPPTEGRTMTMTRRERVVAWVLVAAMVVAWWVLSLSPAVLIGIGSMLGLLAVIEVRGR